MKYITKSRQETENLGREFARGLSGGEKVCLYGNLGAGKTTFVSGIVKYFRPAVRVLSPTFIIVRHYHFQDMPVNNLLHADLYRLENRQSIEAIGLGDFINQPKTVLMIEWAEKLGMLLPADRIDISFKILKGNKREIKYEEVNSKSS